MPELTPTPRAVRGGRAPRARRGLTLVEMMIAITVLGIVGAALTSILTRQQRFYRDASETVVVRRELRRGASLLPTDLRAISTAGGDLLEATATGFTMRATIGSGIVCAKGTSSVDLVPLDLSNHTLTSWYSTPQVNDTVFVFNEGPTDGAGDDSWSQHALTGVPVLSTSYCPGTPFVTTADAGRPKIRLTFDTSLPADVDVGAAVRITRPVRYTIYQPSGAGNWYLGYEEHDGTSWSAREPIAGPLTGGTDARFSYYDTLGVARTPNTPTVRTSIARVDVRLQASGQSDVLRLRGGEPLQDSLNFRIGIRNFR